MTTHPDDELHALRIRAYGPNADILDDPDAVERLRELEGAVGTLAPETANAPEPHAEDAPDAAASGIESSTGLGSVVSDVVSDVAEDNVSNVADGSVIEPALDARRERRRRRRTRRLIGWWVASLLVAVIVAVSVTAFVSRRVQADPREVGVLGVDLGYTLPSFFGGDGADSRAFASFYGMRVMSSGLGWMGDAVGDCINVFNESEVVITSDSVSGPLYTACGAGTFPAALELYVTVSMPEELRAEFPVGSALQFVLDGSEVIVLSDLPR